MEERLYRLPSTEIFTIATGAGPPVICLHGITANAFVFAPVMALLKDGFRVVSIDQRGHGRSGRPDAYEDVDFAGDVVALIAALDAGPAILVGHSLGARNGIVAGALAPERVAGVVAIDFTPFIEDEVFAQLEARVNGGDRRFADLEEVTAYLAQRYPLLPPDAVLRRARHGYRATEDGGLRPLADGRAMALTAAGLRRDLEAPLRRLARPAILVRGASSKLVSEAAFARTRALRPDLAAVVVPEADHYVPEEQPVAIARLVRRFAETAGNAAGSRHRP